MADEKKSDGGGLTNAVPVSVVLALLAGLVITRSLPYQDERPAARPLQSQYAEAQDVEARLWQDPFAAVDGKKEESEADNVALVPPKQDGEPQNEQTKQQLHNPSQIYVGNPVADHDPVAVIAVTLPGGSYQEAAEQRMRRRYAVLSGLVNSGAFPRDEQHIGYFRPDTAKEADLQKRVAFEWWSIATIKKKILLLWVDESTLRGNPNAKLQELLKQATQPAQNKPKDRTYTVIGPNTSTLLSSMLAEVEPDDTPPKKITVQVTARTVRMTKARGWTSVTTPPGLLRPTHI